ncbi:MAG: hypothetical protein WAV90_26495 [Gordonia amarae]
MPTDPGPAEPTPMVLTSPAPVPERCDSIPLPPRWWKPRDDRDPNRRRPLAARFGPPTDDK